MQDLAILHIQVHGSAGNDWSWFGCSRGWHVKKLNGGAWYG